MKIILKLALLFPLVNAVEIQDALRDPNIWSEAMEGGLQVSFNLLSGETMGLSVESLQKIDATKSEDFTTYFVQDGIPYQLVHNPYATAIVKVKANNEQILGMLRDFGHLIQPNIHLSLYFLNMMNPTDDTPDEKVVFDSENFPNQEEMFRLFVESVFIGELFLDHGYGDEPEQGYDDPYPQFYKYLYQGESIKDEDQLKESEFFKNRLKNTFKKFGWIRAVACIRNICVYYGNDAFEDSHDYHLKYDYHIKSLGFELDKFVRRHFEYFFFYQT